MHWRCFFVLILLLSPITRANSAAIPTYTLNDCIEIALQKQQSLNVSNAQIEMAEAMYQQAMSAYWPRLYANVSASRADQDRTFTASGEIPLSSELSGALTAAAASQNPQFAAALNAGLAQPINAIPLDSKLKLYDRDVVRASLNLTYPIFTGFKRSALVNQAEKSVHIAEQSHRKTKLEVIRDVKKYFYATQFALQMEQLARETLQHFEVVEELTELLYKKKSLRIKKTDYLRTKTTTALTRSMLNEAIYAREIAYEALGNAMGQPWNSRYKLAKIPQPKTVNVELERLINAAKNFNPEIQQLTLAIQIADDQITEAQSDYYPMIGIKASAHKTWNGFDKGLINDDNRDGWDISVGMKWNLFSGFETVGKVKHAQAQQKQLKSQRLLLDQGTALQVKQQFLQIRSANRQIRDTETALKYAQENRELNLRAYREELVETKDVIESQLVETYSKSAFYRSQYRLEAGLTSLEYLIGQNIEHLIH